MKIIIESKGEEIDIDFWENPDPTQALNGLIVAQKIIIEKIAKDYNNWINIANVLNEKLKDELKQTMNYGYHRLQIAAQLWKRGVPTFNNIICTDRSGVTVGIENVTTDGIGRIACHRVSNNGKIKATG